MSLELLTQIDGNSFNVQTGLKDFVQKEEKPFSIGDNMKARVATPVLEDGTNLWNTWLDSGSQNFYGNKSQKDDLFRFKTDYDFDLEFLAKAEVNKSDGSILSDYNTYRKSKGTEFLIIKQANLLGADCNYAIRTSKFNEIRDQFKQGNYKIEDLVTAGGFKINKDLAIDEIVKLTKGRNVLDLTAEEISILTSDDFEYVHDGWLEHSTSKNRATEEDYLEGAKSLVEYVQKADEENCFRNSGKGMAFRVETNVDKYKVRPWYVGNGVCGSGANFRSGFDGDGRFLRVPNSAAGAAPEKTEQIEQIEYTQDGIRNYLATDPKPQKGFLKMLTTYIGKHV